MNREDKNSLSRQRILDAALHEFSAKGYRGAALNTVWAEHGISKGIIYHHFKDKNEIYLLCVEMCFKVLTAYLDNATKTLSGTIEERLQGYFDARLRFFTEHPLYLGIFLDATLSPAESLASAIAERRQDFDALNILVLTGLLSSKPLRNGLSVETVVEDFRMYMDFFNLRFRDTLCSGLSSEIVLLKHEERCHRQLNILLHGILVE